MAVTETLQNTERFSFYSTNSTVVQCWWMSRPCWVDGLSGRTLRPLLTLTPQRQTVEVECKHMLMVRSLGQSLFQGDSLLDLKQAGVIVMPKDGANEPSTRHDWM